jgi:hypothetical protein
MAGDAGDAPLEEPTLEGPAGVPYLGTMAGTERVEPVVERADDEQAVL